MSEGIQNFLYYNMQGDQKQAHLYTKLEATKEQQNKSLISE
jgi:hypothetical protein